MEATSKRQTNRLKRKEGKAWSILLNNESVELSNTPTHYLYISNGGLGNGLSREHIYSWLVSTCALVRIEMIVAKPYCFVEVADEDSAIRLRNLSGSKVLHDGILTPIEHHIGYVTSIPTQNSGASSSGVLPEGLVVVEDFITEDDEQQLLDLLSWDHEPQSDTSSGGSMKHRSVRHFGYEFKYSTNNVDPDSPLEDRIPVECDSVIDRLICEGYLTDRPDQLTVNKYLPGQGIPPHVDTHSAFLDPIISLSVGSSVVMNFAHPDGSNCPVLVPRRSVLVMSGASRYLWTHGIVPRKMDVISDKDGLTLNYREIRQSYTFRKLRRASCHCIYPSQCDSQGYDRQRSQTGGKQSDVALELDDTAAIALERLHVHQVYDEIANHFSSTRHSQWPKVSEFIRRQPTYSVMADIGCGNGKYLTPTDNCIFKIGFERSSGLTDICGSRGFPVVIADCLATPLIDGCVDVCICIAVIHHLSTHERRLAAVRELIRVLRPGGECLIYVWAMEQTKGKAKSNYIKSEQLSKQDIPKAPEYLETFDGNCRLPVHKNRTEFISNDMLVPWNLKSKEISCKKTTSKTNTLPNSTSQNSADSAIYEEGKLLETGGNATASENNSNSPVYHRYYHIFKEGELEELCGSVDNCDIVNSYYDQGNWCVILKRHQ